MFSCLFYFVFYCLCLVICSQCTTRFLRHISFSHQINTKNVGISLHGTMTRELEREREREREREWGKRREGEVIDSFTLELNWKKLILPLITEEVVYSGNSVNEKTLRGIPFPFYFLCHNHFGAPPRQKKKKSPKKEWWLKISQTMIPF